MNTTDSPNSKTPATGWRYRVGLTLFVSGHIILASALLIPALGLAEGGKKGIVGVLIVTGELVSLASIFFLGTDGFKRLKDKVFGFFKLERPARPVGLARHRVGMALLLINFIGLYVAAMIVLVGYFRTTKANPFPVVFGMDFHQQGTAFISILIVGELAFIAAVYVLGADWWDRFKALFEWKRRET